MAPDAEDRVTQSDSAAQPDFEPVKISQKKSRKGLWVGLVVAAVVVAGGAWYGLGSGMSGAKDDKVPVIRADVNPVKERPAAPGGMEIANRDKKIYDRVEGGGVQPTFERLLPEAEQAEPMPTLNQAAKQAALPDVPTAESAESLIEPESPLPPAVPAGTPTPLTPPLSADEMATVQPAPAAVVTPSVEPAAPPAAPTAPAASVAIPEPPKAPEPARTAALTPPVSSDGIEPFYRVQVAAVRTDAAAKTAFTSVQKKHQDLFADKSLYVQRADLGEPKGVYYRVRIGPYSDKGQAGQVCSVLKARGAACLVVRPGK